MTASTSARCRSSRSGFTLVELLISLTIMLIMVGVAGSILSSVIQLHQTTDELSYAERRANDAFNIIGSAINGVGIGVPPKDLNRFLPDIPAFSSGWDTPIAVDSSPLSVKYGDRLRVVWGMPTGLRYIGSSPVTAFADTHAEYAEGHETILLSGTNMSPFTSANGPMRINTGGQQDDKKDYRSYVTFPGVGNAPLFISNADTHPDGTVELTLNGRAPAARSDDMLSRSISRGVIDSCSPLYALRATEFFVADDAVLYAVDLPSDGVSPVNTATASYRDIPGFRLEGIKAVRFFVSPSNRTFTACVLVEGDISDENRHVDSNSIDDVRSRIAIVGDDEIELWKDVEFNTNGVWYQDFSRTWRTRSVQ